LSPAIFGDQRLARLIADSDPQVGPTGRSMMIELGHRIAPLFARPEPRQQAMRYVLGLLGPAARKNSWQLAETTGDNAPWAMQRLLTRAHWDADGVRDEVREVLIRGLAAPDAVLVLQQAAMLKKGNNSVAVARQYAELTGRPENCQIGVFASYHCGPGMAIIDRELYLPPGWTRDPRRCRAAGVPAQRLEWQSTGELGRRLVERTLAAAPLGWVRAGPAFGAEPALRHWLERRRVGYVLEVPPSLVAATQYGVAPVGALAGAAPGLTWLRDGTGGQWCWLPARLRTRVSAVLGGAPGTGFVHALLLHRAAAGPPAIRYYLCHGPLNTRLARLVAIAGTELAARQCLRDARSRVGIDRYEVRMWPAWYRHVTLALLAHGCLGAQDPRPDAASSAAHA
jgi:SRSO17 transposase